jgi:hypothetical protein
MSLTAFKRKSVIEYGSKRSAKSPGGYWLPQGPFGAGTKGLQIAIKNYGPVGFSLNGTHRNVGGVGKSYAMSKSGTPYRGIHAIGWGGHRGRYVRAEPLLNSQEVDTLGQQYLFVKQSVLSTKGMLEKKYRWAYTGKYPNYWVQPIYTGNQTDTKSQGLYVQNLASANTCNLKVNSVGLYEGHIVNSGPTLCGTSTALFTYNDMARNGPYTKILHQPVSYAQYNLYIARGCNNPQGPQKPFPYAVNTGSVYAAAGTSITSFGSACNTSNTYLAPPEWYVATNKAQQQNLDENTTSVIPQTLPIINE